MSSLSSLSTNSIPITDTQTNLIMAGGVNKRFHHANPSFIQDAQASAQSNPTQTNIESGHTFTLFPKLPYEVRLKVWKAALPGPRFIEIRSADPSPDKLEDDECSIDEHGIDCETWRPSCIEKAPAMFFTCREARAEVMKFYAPLKGNEPSAGIVFCDFSKDYMVFSFPRFREYLSDWINGDDEIVAETWAKVKQVAIDEESHAYCTKDEDLGDVTSMQLDELAIVPCQYERVSKSSPFIIGFEDVEDPRVRQENEDGYFPEWEKEYPEWKAPRLRVGKFITSE